METAFSTGSSHLALSEDQKRWLVAGIALNKTLTQQIRPFVEQGIITEYNNLKVSHRIHVQGPHGRLQSWPASSKKLLKYENINENVSRPKLQGGKFNYSSFDCQVKSHVDFAKLYVQGFMAKFTAFDDRCDASAVLSLLDGVPVFSAAARSANDVRMARNDWAHCVFKKWNLSKFKKSFTDMEQLVRNMALPPIDQRELLVELKDWQTKGTHFCSNSLVDPTLLQVIQQELKSLQDVVDNASVALFQQKTKIQHKLRSMTVTLIYMDKRLQNLESHADQTDGRLDDVEERMRKLENSEQTAVIHTVHSEGVASLQDEISLLSNTPHPIQEQVIESTNTEESPLVGMPPQGEASMNYEDFFVSEKLQESEHKGLLDKLILGLGNPANHLIANWEHLACSTEVKAPLLTRLKCKLPKNHSHTLQLFQVLTGHVCDDGEVVTMAKLVEALKKMGRNDVARILEDACLADDKISTQTLRDFLKSQSNSDLVAQIVTKLDNVSSRLISNWKHLGNHFGIKSVTLDTIEYCFPHNPAKMLMEYLISNEESLTVENLYKRVEQNLEGRADVLGALEPFYKGDNETDKPLKDVINPDIDLDEFYLCLNKKSLKNWKHLANAYGIPYQIYNNFDSDKPQSPAEKFFEWLFVNKAELTLGQLCNALERVKRIDLVLEIRNYFEPCSPSQH